MWWVCCVFVYVVGVLCVMGGVCVCVCSYKEQGTHIIIWLYDTSAANNRAETLKKY
jgi:hypothetical protein